MPNTYNKNGKMQQENNPEMNDIEKDQNEHQISDEEMIDQVNEAELNQDEQSSHDEDFCSYCQSTRKENSEMKIRFLAEMDNFKKRMQREKEENAKYASENVLQDIIPALDNLDLALQYANNDACKDIIMGIQMTRKLLLDSLKNHGLEQINAEKVEFDPNLHEAVGQEESDEVAPQYVIKTLQKGYTLKDRLLRPAKVIVSK